MNVVAFSGGKDSTALALRMRELGEPFAMLFTPTGNELPPLKAHFDEGARVSFSLSLGGSMTAKIAKTDEECCPSTLEAALPGITTARQIRCCYVTGHDQYHCDDSGRVTWINPSRPWPLSVEPGPHVDTFESQLRRLLNTWSMEKTSDTPDFVLCQYMATSLEAFSAAVRRRDHWYGFKPFAANKAVATSSPVAPPHEDSSP